MELDANLYGTSRCVPLNSARLFVVKTIPEMGWSKSTDEEFVLDVGCGSGGTTKQLILPLFQNVKKIFAIDALPSMIASAKNLNSSPQIDYFVANIDNWSTANHLDNQITKVVSILCFNWVKDQRESFYNTSRFLKQGGEAAIFFALQGGFFDAILNMKKNRKWSHLFEGVETYVPESHSMGYDAAYYVKMVDELGFEVKYCKVEEKFDVFTSEEEYRSFYTSICVLRKYVPENLREEFENEYMEELFRKNGRDSSGLPRHRGKMIELIIKKK